MEHIRETDRKLSLHKEYIADAKRAKKARQNDLDGRIDDNPWMANSDNYEHDEDMMADL